MAYIVRHKNDEKIELNSKEMLLGRYLTMTDYYIDNNSYVSKVHAKIVENNNKYYVVDCDSLNKTYLNLVLLKPNESYELNDGDEIKLANEKFTFHVVEE